MAWGGAICYMIQIYMDFSGYSDMAIGIGQMLGFKLPENFNEPYTALSISDFWRRWHMSLSSWFRDYLYIPLGGSHCSTVKWIRNVLIVWLCTGLWHGAATNFLLWGVYFGIILIIEKLILTKVSVKFSRSISHFYVLVILLFGWVLFRADGLYSAWDYLNEMFNFNTPLLLIRLKQLDLLYLYPFGLVGVFLCTPYAKKLYLWLDDNHGLILDLFLIITLGLSIILMINNSYNPFIYFNF